MNKTRYVFLCLGLLLLILNNRVYASSWDSTFYSSTIKDSFRVHVNTPRGYNKESLKKYKIVCYTDANLKVGHSIVEIYESNEVKSFSLDYITVGIESIGYYRNTRRRDLIVSLESDSFEHNKEFGQANTFLKFLNDSILPYIYKSFNVTKDSTCFIGHSFGGLFGTYALLSQSEIFQSYIILSPSYWANNGSIFSFIDSSNLDQDINLFLACGGLEVFNRVYPSVKNFERRMTNNAFNQIKLTARVYKCSTHNSYIKSGLTDGLCWLLDNSAVK